MKILTRIVFIILGIISIPLIIALFISKDASYAQTIEINAPIDVVWEQTNSLEDLDKWSPWNDYDPAMKKEMSGIDGTIGAKQSWESDAKEVGTGSQTISKIEAPNFFGTDLKFYVPYESEAKGYVKLAQEGDVTFATWGFESTMPYPMNLMKLVYNFEDMMAADWQKGLSRLKNLSEVSYANQKVETIEENK